MFSPLLTQYHTHFRIKLSMFPASECHIQKRLFDSAKKIQIKPLTDYIKSSDGLPVSAKHINVNLSCGIKNVLRNLTA